MTNYNYNPHHGSSLEDVLDEFILEETTIEAEKRVSDWVLSTDEIDHSEYIDQVAYNAGYNAFVNGQRKQIKFTKSQKLDIDRRLRRMKISNKKADAIALSLRDQGIHLVDTYRETVVDGVKVTSEYPSETTGYIMIMASNPYNKSVYAYKEWERGYNAAYYSSLKKAYYRNLNNKSKGKKSK